MSSGKLWLKIKWIFLFVFIFHTICFLIFLIEQFNEAGFPVTRLPLKLSLVVGFVLVFAFCYITWLRQVAWIKRIAIFTRELFFILYITSSVYILLGALINPPITITQLVEIVKGNGFHRDYVRYDNMSPNIKLAVLASEDQLFTDHDGFDLKAIKKAIKYNNRHTQKQRGASTISQQTAKNIFLWQGGGFFRKGMEVYFTYTIEKVWSKKTILSRYLNVSEMGRGIFGVEAAAQQYFHKDAWSLTREEAAKIAACLPSPKRFTVVPVSRYVAFRTPRIIAQMNNLARDPDVQELLK